MASNVTPSIPGAPSFCLAIAYAARRVSILQTWTYSPQKRQDGSAFALTYSLRLRSCKSMDAFVISSLPSLHWRHCNGRAPSLHGHYSASSLLRTQPPPSRLRPTSRCRRLYGLQRESIVASKKVAPRAEPTSEGRRQHEQPNTDRYGCSPRRGGSDGTATRTC